jgi:hypothetical protein
VLKLFTKPLTDLSYEDLEELVELEAPESTALEFKQELPGRDGAADPWMRGEDRIGDLAKRELARHVCGFANAQGGWLLIGIREAGDEPSRAAEITPVPRAAELARRLEQALGDGVEPALRSTSARAVLAEDGESGVIVIRVPQSRLAPHRVSFSGTQKDAYVRRNARTLEMTMREIQDATLMAATGSRAVEQMMERLRRTFLEERPPATVVPITEASYRISAIPTRAELQFERVFMSPELFTLRRGVNMTLAPNVMPGFPAGSGVLGRPGHPTPILRGGRAVATDQRQKTALSIYEHGAVDLSLWWKHDQPTLHDVWLVADFLNVAEAALRFAAAAGAAGSEYVIEVELRAREFEPAGDGAWTISDAPVALMPFPENRNAREFTSVRLDGYLFSDEQGAKAITLRFFNDLQNLCGRPGFPDAAFAAEGPG